MALWLVLIILGLCLGFYLGYQWRRGHEPNSPIKFHRDYLAGLNLLLNDQPDKAVDIFIKLLKVDEDTVETHISLGNLFRRRGEIDRALRIHQALLDGGEINQEQRVQVLIELGYDYLSAGVFDRAERLFIEAVNLDESRSQVLYSLLDIYQKEKNWQKAIMIAKKAELATGKSLHQAIAHFYCELAASQSKEVALNTLDEALDCDKKCVRANLMKGALYMADQHYKQALLCLQKIKQQDVRFLPEAIEAIVKCHEQLGETKELEGYLNQLIADFPAIPFALVLSNYLKTSQGDAAAEAFLIEYVRQSPSFSGLKFLVDMHVVQVDGKVKEDLTILQRLIQRLLAKKPKYRCAHCGFSGRTLHWECIGCRRWGTLLPVLGEEF